MTAQQRGEAMTIHQRPQSRFRKSPGWPLGEGPGQPEKPRKSWASRHKVLTGIGVVIALGAVVFINRITQQYNAIVNAPAFAQTVATFTGSGDENTPAFTVSSTWKLSYTFDCSALGFAGNFQVFEDGGDDSAVTVNDLADSKSASTYAYDDDGTHWLKIISDCTWTVTVTG